MIVLCWVLGFKADRNWADWGMPVCPGMAPALPIRANHHLRRLDSSLLQMPCRHGAPGRPALSPKATNDLGRRYSGSTAPICLVRQRSPSLQGWLPEGDGIFYTSQMGFFYDTFYVNPRAPWRYIVGYEPALMPDDDLKIYRDIQKSGGAIQAYKPWADKLRPADRLRQFTAPPSPTCRSWNGITDRLGALDWKAKK